MVEKRVKKFGQGPPPPFSGNARKKSIFLCEVFPYITSMYEGVCTYNYHSKCGDLVSHLLRLSSRDCHLSCTLLHCLPKWSTWRYAMTGLFTIPLPHSFVTICRCAPSPATKCWCTLASHFSPALKSPKDM